MCGIFAYTGTGSALFSVLQGLRDLEYRGYDSAGVSWITGQMIQIIRACGGIDALERRLGSPLPSPSICTGHTRWATHGAPVEKNAHPHTSQDGKISVVHNGIVENYAELKAEVESGGALLRSETDSEVIPFLIQKYYRGDIREALFRTTERLRGTYAIAVLCADQPRQILACRFGSPLCLGIMDGAAVAASDAVPVIRHTRKIIYLEDGDIASVTPEKTEVRSAGQKPVIREAVVSDLEPSDIQRSGYPHFMLKEIFEQPDVLSRMIQARLTKTTDEIDLPEIGRDPHMYGRLQRIVIAACGTSWHAGLIGRNIIERICRLPVSVEYASDFRYRDPVVDASVLVIAISQSGETADTLGAVLTASERGAAVLAVCNVRDSSIARAANAVLYTDAGPEIGVASTKAFTSQILALYFFALFAADRRNTISGREFSRRCADIRSLPELVRKTLDKSEIIEKISARYLACGNALFLGRGTGYPLALEGALKLKEISYIHAEGYHAGEMKHGPIALIDEKMPVVVLALQGRRYDKIMNNIQEVRSRGGRIIAVASEGDSRIHTLAHDVISVSDAGSFINAVICAVPLQLLAYFIAAGRGCDIDQPRNLAKSVTVE